ncbi:type II toxin-antitoxin system death-on-curing family toxin [Pseudomonas guariconensis]|uniref:Type II toxin-antitoxin system death-on-curing family toxin n=1 Tax=Pseudomonas guariconensis TaxID=1288410 RepID=A0AAX0VRM7_9PSED|nr:type II toxin-antitoxin system death-on-curing family toxin [Pseudomonas guariconensis]PLV12887.1 type II toxin-antitoxin system death-on-curing family toxin [Pseudomonas guariconensis]PLV20958.1 type II toxin-antitoxin system death-on-curing family toxin [Pseudomonas guariconensis]PLV26587.1 type II toxin-antitoxin system death-on-curing family toxin [Pseudomonas guariconensis]
MPARCKGLLYLSCEDLILINERLIKMKTPGELCGVLNQAGLETAQQSIGMHRYYAQTEDVITLASVLFESLARNHPFHNANKRTAVVATSIFMLMNGYELTAPGDDLVEIAVAVVTHVVDRETLEDFLYHWHRPIDELEALGNDSLRRLIDRTMRN